MDITFLLVLVAIALVVGLFAIAFRMDKRVKQVTPPLPKPGKAGTILLRLAWVILGCVVLAIICAIVFKSITYAQLAASLIGLYIFTGIIYRIVRSK